MSKPARRARALAAAAVVLLGTSLLTACDNGPDLPDGSSGGSSGETAGLAADDGPEPSPSATGAGQDAGESGGSISMNVKAGATDVPVDTELVVTAADGSLTAVAVTGSDEIGPLAGEIAPDGTGWRAGDLLEPGTTYSVEATVEGEDGESVTRRERFTTQDLTLDQQTYASVAPLPGETVGVGMPVIVTFDVPVTDRAAIEKHLSVTSTPAQPGTWHWLSDTEVHYRPRTFWAAGTQVAVDLDINGVAAGNGIYGQESRHVDFAVGDAHIYKVDTVSDQMKVFSNGDLLRTIPITTGEQPQYTTRSGTKVIIEKFDAKDMNSETVGITGADAYNLSGVQWAMRVTFSGEFIHAAPWSVGSQGHANVSHGCTGMSTANADWLYHMSLRGDVVQYTGTDRTIESGNGWDDWNVSWLDYKQGSALA